MVSIVRKGESDSKKDTIQDLEVFGRAWPG